MGLTRALWEQNPKQAVSSAETYNTRKEIEQTQTGVTWTKPLDDHNELYAMTYVGNRHVIQYQSIPKSTQTNVNNAGGVIDFDRNYYGADFRWTGKELLPNTSISAGVALDSMDEDRKGYNNYDASGNYGVKGTLRRNEDNTLWNIDPYLQASWQFLPTWRLDTGVRYSNVHYKSDDHYLINGNDSGKTEYAKTLPSAALSWQIVPELLAYVSYAKGFETPTFTEMAYRTDGAAGFNFNLKPSSSDNYEMGLKSKNPWGYFTLAAFQSKTKNDIVSYATVNGRATYQNVDKTQRQGVEFSWNKNLWKDLKAQASYSYLDATFDSDFSSASGTVKKGTYIPGIAKNQAFARLAWQPQTGMFAGIEAHYMDKIYVNDANSDAAPSYTVTAIDVGYKWKIQDWAINTYARVDNLFDRNYVGSVIVNDGNGRYFEPAEGRNWSAGLSITKQF